MTTQEKILIALDDEYKAYSFYNKAMQLYGMPFANLFQSEANHINALSLHLQNLNVPIPQNPYEDIVIPNTLSGALEAAIENENQNIALYNSSNILWCLILFIVCKPLLLTITFLHSLML